MNVSASSTMDRKSVAMDGSEKEALPEHAVLLRRRRSVIPAPSE
jgi:hypothetical protein